MAKALAAAQKVGAQEQLAELEAEEEDSEAAEVETPPAKSDDKAAAKTDKPKDEKPAPAKPTGDLAKARKLMATDPIAAVREVFGDEGVKALRVDSKAFADLRGERRKAEQRLAKQRESIQQEAREISVALKRDYDAVRPLVEAKQAYDAGDYQTAFQKAFGEDINDFQKKALRQKMGEDPRVTKLERELKAEREQRTQREREEQARQQETAHQRAQLEYMEDLATQLSEAEDPRVTKAARKQSFVRRVFQLQQEHWDDYSQTTLPVAEAAEMALQELLGTWGDVFGVEPGEAAPQRQSGQADPPVKPTPRKPRVSLSQQEASEATPPGPRLSDEDIIRKYERIMSREALRERAAG